MKKQIRLLTLILLVSMVKSLAQRNVVVILADDLRADALGCYGNTYVKTPNIDALAKTGFKFNNAYILGGDQGAICSPSRAMLMAGKSYFRISNRLKGEMTLPKLLKQRGYETLMTGKWHNEKEAVVEGFTQAKNIMFGGMADHFTTPMQDLKSDGSFTSVEKKGYSTEIFTETALQFLDNQSNTKPFFLYVPFTTPHDPRSPLPKHAALFDEKNIPLPPNFMPLHPFSFGYSMGGRDEFLAAFPRTPELIRAQIADYYAMIAHLDESVGRIINKLKAKGLDKNTLIVFASDNGLGMGSHGLMGKQNMYEHSMRVPLIFSGLKTPQGKSTDEMAYLLDVFPTICQYLSLEQPKNIDGKPLNTLINGKGKGRDGIMTAYIGHQRAVRNERYKLIKFPTVDHQLLFDLKNDPHELVNLANMPEYQSIVNNLTELLKTKQKEMGDNLPLTASSIEPKVWDYKILKTEPDKSQPDYILKKYFGKER